MTSNMGKQHSLCALCGKTIVDLHESSILNEVIDGISYNFDTNECVMMYKRFRSVYGDDFKFLAPQEQFVSDHFWNRGTRLAPMPCDAPVITTTLPLATSTRT